MPSIREKLCCLNTPVLEPSLSRPKSVTPPDSKITRTWDDVIKETQPSRPVPPPSGRIRPKNSPAEPIPTVSLAKLSDNQPLLNSDPTSEITAPPKPSSVLSVTKREKPPNDLSDLDLPLTVKELEKLGVAPSILKRYEDLNVPYREGTPDHKIYRVHWLWVQIIKRPLPRKDQIHRFTRYRAVL